MTAKLHRRMFSKNDPNPLHRVLTEIIFQNTISIIVLKFLLSAAVLHSVLCTAGITIHKCPKAIKNKPLYHC